MSIFPSFFSNTQIQENEIPNIFPLALQNGDFIKYDIFSTYSKILTDTLDRTHGIPKDKMPLMWDNCVQNESPEGLITLLAKAMTDKNDLFLVYKKSVNVLRLATQEEQKKIEADYKAEGKSATGVFISFKKYQRTTMLEIYSALEYCILNSLHKSLNISKSIQLKLKGLRASVSLNDVEIAKNQAKSIAKALTKGSDIMLDKEDEVTTATVDTSPTEKAIGFLDAKRAFILCLPIPYISGLQTGGLGSTGEADMRAIERGLKQYFLSILQPTIKALFGVDVEFKTQDFRQITSALEALKTFDLVSNESLSQESKQEIIARMFDLDQDEEKKAIQAEANSQPDNTPPPTQNPPSQ